MYLSAERQRPSSIATIVHDLITTRRSSTMISFYVSVIAAAAAAAEAAVSINIHMMYNILSISKSGHERKTVTAFKDILIFGPIEIREYYPLDPEWIQISSTYS